ncbi:hypothetical protein AAY473_034498 [Plecturocebus cupreus]
MRSLYAAQAGLEILASSDPPTLPSQSAVFTDTFTVMNVEQVHTCTLHIFGCQLDAKASASTLGQGNRKRERGDEQKTHRNLQSSYGRTNLLSALSRPN